MSLIAGRSVGVRLTCHFLTNLGALSRHLSFLNPSVRIDVVVSDESAQVLYLSLYFLTVKAPAQEASPSSRERRADGVQMLELEASLSDVVA